MCQIGTDSYWLAMSVSQSVAARLGPMTRLLPETPTGTEAGDTHQPVTEMAALTDRLEAVGMPANDRPVPDTVRTTEDKVDPSRRWWSTEQCPAIDCTG